MNQYTSHVHSNHHLYNLGIGDVCNGKSDRDRCDLVVCRAGGEGEREREGRDGRQEK